MLFPFKSDIRKVVLKNYKDKLKINKNVKHKYYNLSFTLNDVQMFTATHSRNLNVPLIGNL